MIEILRENPFQITTPEDLTADETVSLFVDVFTDFQKIIDPGHVFLIGPRGSGKSMMFRYLQPDCQCIVKNCNISALPFLGIYIPLKNTNFALAELRRLEHRHASDILSEHILVTHFCIKIFQTLAKTELYPLDGDDDLVAKDYYNNIFLPILLKTTFNNNNYQLKNEKSVTEVFSKIERISEELYNDAFNYAKKLAFRKELLPYDGPLCDYLSFLYPILSGLSELYEFPQGSIYLLIDDAHWLTETQAKVLNSWVATRTSRKVSLKISTQYNYSTYYTKTGDSIDTPHDYSEIDITTIYTGSAKSKYRDRISDIVNKRLEVFGLGDITPGELFPEDTKQEMEINRIAEEYKKQYDDGKGRGHYRNDDAYRYSRPDYIKSLAGQKKSSSTYHYAGFNQLVHLSSGIVRHFLHPAHLMYADAKSQSSEERIISIDPTIQNKIIRDEADIFLFTELEKIGKECNDNAPHKEDIKNLSNLIQGLGGLFRQILLSDRSERRVFSIAFSDETSDSVTQILDLGVQLGYFHKSTIGRKDSKSGGRTRLYVLNRRLAPIWTLDPTGFAGYLFVQNRFIELAIENPSELLRKMTRDGLSKYTEMITLEHFGGVFDGES